MFTSLTQTVQNTLLREYGIDGVVRALPGEYDLNFEIAATHQHFVFKVMRADCDPQFVDMQIAAMECAKRAGMAELVPTVFRTKSGASQIIMVDDHGRHRVAWLLSFLPGAVMAEIEPWTPALTASIGNLLGRLNLALEGFEHPLLDRELKWDLCRADWIVPHTGVIAKAERRALVDRIMQLFTLEVRTQLRARP